MFFYISNQTAKNERRQKVYRKETSKPWSSAHPGHVIPNVIYSMAFRMLRICSRESVFEERLDEIKNDFWIPRYYHPKVIKAKFKKIRNLLGADFVDKRQNSLIKRISQDQQTNRLTAPFNFDPFPIFTKQFYDFQETWAKTSFSSCAHGSIEAAT